MRGLRQLADIEPLALAVGLLNHGARASVVRAATGLRRQPVRGLCGMQPGDSLRPGPLLATAAALLRPYLRHRQAVLFAALYQRPPGDPTRLEGWRVLYAFERYLELAPTDAHRLDINAAWIVARDLRAGWVTLRRCPHCGTPFLQAPAHADCPNCRQPAPAAPRLVFPATHPRPTGPSTDLNRLRGAITRPEADRLALALGLLGHGARTPVVQAATQLPRSLLVALHQALHGCSNRPGQLPVSASALLHPHGRHPHVVLLAALYQRPPADAARLEGWRVLHAFERYLELAPVGPHRLDINAAWIVARDLRTGLVTLCRCSHCAMPFLQAPESAACPFCRPHARAALRRCESPARPPAPPRTVAPSAATVAPPLRRAAR